MAEEAAFGATDDIFAAMNRESGTLDDAAARTSAMAQRLPHLLNSGRKRRRSYAAIESPLPSHADDGGDEDVSDGSDHGDEDVEEDDDGDDARPRLRQQHHHADPSRMTADRLLGRTSKSTANAEDSLVGLVARNDRSKSLAAYVHNLSKKVKGLSRGGVGTAAGSGSTGVGMPAPMKKQKRLSAHVAAATITSSSNRSRVTSRGLSEGGVDAKIDKRTWSVNFKLRDSDDEDESFMEEHNGGGADYDSDDLKS